MKKLLTLTAVGAMLAAPAMAVQKCVALSQSIAGDYSPAKAIKRDVDWSVAFIEANITVSGIGILSDTTGKIGDTVTELSVDLDTPANNQYCWCKITSPGVSDWIYSQINSSVSCTDNCVIGVANVSSLSTIVRRAAFETLSD